MNKVACLLPVWMLVLVGITGCSGSVLEPTNSREDWQQVYLLGLADWHRGRYQKSQTLLLQALNKALTDRAHPLKAALSWQALGDVYVATGAYAQAGHAYTNAARIFADAARVRDSSAHVLANEVARTDYRLGSCYLAQNQPAEAAPFFKKALATLDAKTPVGLALKVKILQECARDLSLTRAVGLHGVEGEAAVTALGQDLMDRRAGELAGIDAYVSFARKALAKKQTVVVTAALAPAMALLATSCREHRDNCRQVEDLAALYLAVGSFEAAEEPYKQLYTSGLAKDSPETRLFGNALLELASRLVGQGKLDRGQELYERAVKLRVAVIGPDSPATAEAYLRLAQVQFLRKQGDCGNKLFTRAAKILRQDADANAYNFCLALQGCAHYFWSQEQFDKAASFYREAHDVAVRKYGADSELVPPLLRNLGWLYRAAGKTDQAKAALEQAIACHERHRHRDDNDYVQALTALAEILESQQQLPRAQALRKRAAQLKR